MLERLDLRDHLVKFRVGRHGDSHRDLVGSSSTVLIDVERPERGLERVHDLSDLTDDRRLHIGHDLQRTLETASGRGVRPFHFLDSVRVWTTRCPSAAILCSGTMCSGL